MLAAGRTDTRAIARSEPRPDFALPACDGSFPLMHNGAGHAHPGNAVSAAIEMRDQENARVAAAVRFGTRSLA